MFAAKSTILLTLFAASVHLVAAATPGCLLAAINTEPDPSDLNTICGADASKVQSQIKGLCGSYTNAALTAFETVCKSAGKSVPSASVSGSSATSASGSSTASASATSSSTLSSVSGGVTSGSALPSITSAPYGSGNATIVYTSTFYDTACSCTKTAAFSATTNIGSTGFASATGSPSGATGSPIAPVSSNAPSGTSSASSPAFTGAAPKTHLSLYATFIVGAIGIVLAA